MTLVERKLFGWQCDGLVIAVRRAADPAVPVYVPYYGQVVYCAYWNARFVMRAARHLRLIHEDE